MRWLVRTETHGLSRCVHCRGAIAEILHWFGRSFRRFKCRLKKVERVWDAGSAGMTDKEESIQNESVESVLCLFGSELRSYKLPSAMNNGSGR